MEKVISVLEARAENHRQMREQTSLVTVVAMENELVLIVTMLANELRDTEPEAAKQLSDLSLRLTA